MASRFFVLLLALLSVLLPTPARALNPLTPLKDYHRASWLTKDGAPPEIRSMAQTADGWLWLTGPSGLYRFDGVRFERYLPSGAGDLSRRRVSMVRAHPNGDLWLSYQLGGGLSVLHPNGKLDDVIAPGKLPPVTALAFDTNGDFWSATVGGLFRYHAGKLQHYGEAQGMPKEVLDVRIDRYGRLWVASTLALHLYDRGADRFSSVRPLILNSELIESPDGRVWTANFSEVAAVPPPPEPRPTMRAAEAAGFGSHWIARFDRDGNLWRLQCPEAFCVIPAAEVTAVNRVGSPVGAQLRAGPVISTGNVIIEDREGNIWTTTQEGLDRYRDNRLQRISLSDTRNTFTLATDAAGRMLASNPYNKSVWRLRADAAPQIEATPAWLVANDSTGALLLGGGRYIERRTAGGSEQIALPELPGPDGKPESLVLMGLTDDGKRLWAVSPRTGLIARVDGQWLPRAKFNLPQQIILGAAGAKPGHLWLACADASIVLFDENDQQTRYPAAMIGFPTGIFSNADIVAAGDQGLAVLTNGAFRQLRAADPEVLQDVSGLAVDAEGNHWLNGGKGLLRVRRADWQASVAEPTLPLRYQLFGVQDGYAGKAMLENRHPSAKLDKDGQLWLAATGGILRIDTRNIRRNDIAPVAKVSGVHGEAQRYDPQPGLQLPAGTQNIDISYTAASLSQPESVRFQYRLQGTDRDWQDVGTRRTAFYTNMAPGAYRFQVRAMNEDGVWSAQPASVDFSIPPTFTQTLWFKLACFLAAALALYLLYLYRLRVVTTRLEERMEVRLAERERIARALHDTFLQTVQGVVLRLDSAVDALPDDSAARKSLAPVLHSARASINEGRAQVQDLRSSPADEVESVLREVAALLAASYPGVAFTLAVDGERRALRSGVIDEISEIGREAVRNAYQHAQALHIEVQLGYEAQQFTLLVRDDGKGMAPAPPASGHWGLVGMRERAARIGAALEIASTPNQGSHVKMALSAHRAYALKTLPWWRRLFRK
ncbi:triple tyrosine motif-containing protein [Duganella sp. BuS-21]|uniref:sensor histidine kinase n=1 Tax=Duganella sp. BuS-21 TaxID=2943848 RepID=UPI0035A63DAD